MGRRQGRDDSGRRRLRAGRSPATWHIATSRRSDGWTGYGEDGFADELDLGCAHGGECGVRGLARDSRRQVEQHGRLEALFRGVQGRGPDTVIGGDADDVDLLNCPVPQPVGECDASVALRREALEAAVRRFVPALAEDRLDVFKGRLGGWVEERPSVPILQCAGQLLT